MKITVLTSSLDHTNGWGRYTVGVLRALGAQGLEFEVYCTRGHVMHADDISAEPVLSAEHRYGLGRIGASLRDARLVASRARGRLVHVFVEPYALVPLFIRKPYILTAHGTFFPRYLDNFFGRMPTAYALNHAKKVVAISEFTKAKIAQRVSVPGMTYLPNGVDAGLFSPGTQGREPLMVTVGAVKPRKGQDLGIQALERLAYRFPDLRYVIVGDLSDAEFVQTLRRRIAETKLEARVEFLQGVSDDVLIDLYRRASVFILPSRVDQHGAFEGFPLSLLEANSCGAPVIGTRGCGAEHLILEGKNGLLIDQESEDQLTDAIARILEDGQLRASMEEHARARALEFSWQNHARALVAIYEQALA